MLFCVGCNQYFSGQRPTETCPATGSCPDCGHETAADVSQLNETIPYEADSQLPAFIPERVGTDSLIGRQFHVYRCVSLLGRGGMGKVYLATHNDLQRRCALKILSPRRASSDQDFVDRFLEEGRATAALVHPNIVTIHALGEYEGEHFIEMEFVSGRSLQDLIRDEGALPIPRALSLITQTARGLAAAHREGIVHRDVKPDNIMLSRQGTPKIGDFGLAKRVLDGQGQPVQTGLCGTPNYMAPELFAGQPATPASDVYALGVCLYFMLIGEMPHRSRSMSDLRWKVSSDPIPNIRDIMPNFSLELASTVAKLTDPTPGNRPANAIEASQLLCAVLGHERDLESLFAEAFPDCSNIRWSHNGKERYILECHLPGKRHQNVFVEPSGHRIEERLLLFYSISCPADPSYYEQALRLNSEMLHGSLAIREYQGEPYFVIANSYPRATVDPEEIHATVLEIARHADQVEHLLTGQDQH